jgi:hypothetical protein
LHADASQVGELHADAADEKDADAADEMLLK